MLILACDTSNRACSSCLWKDGTCIDSAFRNDGLTHSQTFMPQVHALMEKNHIEYETLDALACTVGPGSFTGIRIGVSAVKTMAMALEKPAVPVSSLEAMAYPLRDEDALVVPLIDCRNHRAWSAAYYHREQVLSEVADDVDHIRENCISYRDTNLSGKKILLVGNGAAMFLEGLSEEALAEYREGFDEIHPESMAAIAEKTLLSEDETTRNSAFAADALMPVYLARTQAERTANEQGREQVEVPIRYYSTQDEK